jgi:hypothetical protein
MAEDSFRKAVLSWIDVNSWPRPTPGLEDEPKTILIITGAAKDGSAFSFFAAFGYFEVKATYHRSKNELSSVVVALVVPKHPNEVDLINEKSYELTPKDGKDLSFNIGKDVIKGTLSFKYADKDNRREIALKYDVNLPFAGHLEGTTALCPTELNPNSGFTTAELNTIPGLAASELQLQKEVAPTHSATGTKVIQAQQGATPPEHELLLKFLDDFARDGDKIIIETFYGGLNDKHSSVVTPVAHFLAVDDSKSSQYHVSISFLGVFSLDGSVDPKNLKITAELFVQVPIAGRVSISKVQGSLGSKAGVKVKINAVVAKGKATLTAEKDDGNEKGKHDLYIDVNINVKGVGDVNSKGKLRLLTLPF